MAKFNIGDRVRCIETTNYVNQGDVGTVAEDSTFPFVIWDSCRRTDDKTWAIKEDQLELLTPQYTPITPKVGEKYRVLKPGLMDIHGGTRRLQTPGETFTVTDIDIDGDIWCDKLWFNKITFTTEYLELVSEPAPTQVTTGKGFLSSIKLSDLPANQTITVVDNGRMHWTMTEEEPINQSIIKKTMNFIKKSLLSKDDKNLIKAGFMDDNMNLTGRGREALEFITFTENKAKLVEMAEAQIAEDKEDKE